MFAVVVTLTLKPDVREAFMALMHQNARRSLSEELGCHRFDVATDPDRPDEVFLYELYSDAAAFQAHLQSAHFAAFDKSTAAMIAHKDVRTYCEVHQ